MSASSCKTVKLIHWSLAGLRGNVTTSAFSAGLRALSQSLAKEFGKQNIHVAHVSFFFLFLRLSILTDDDSFLLYRQSSMEVRSSFCYTVKTQRLKLLACAECDLGPLGWSEEGGSEYWLACSRVRYGINDSWDRRLSVRVPTAERMSFVDVFDAKKKLVPKVCSSSLSLHTELKLFHVIYQVQPMVNPFMGFSGGCISSCCAHHCKSRAWKWYSCY